MAILQKITKKNNLILLILFISVIFLRFYKINERFIFDIDVQYQALLAKTILKHFHILWIGVSASNVGYYLGPGLVYLTSSLLWLTHGDPIILGYFSAFIGVMTAVSLYFVCLNLYNNKIALISTVIYGFSSYIIYYDQKYWPIFIPLISIWMFYSLIKAKTNYKFLILSIFLISISYHIHISLFIFWPFIILRFITQFKKINISTWISSIIIYVTITFPLMVFDYVHNFDNFFTPFRFLSKILSKTSTTTNLHFDFLFQSINKIFLINITGYQIIGLIFSVLLILISLTVYKQKIKNNNLLFVIIIFFCLLYGFFPGTIQEYYLVFLFPFLSIIISQFISKIPKLITITLLLMFLIINIFNTLNRYENRGLSIKKNLIKNISANINEDFYLTYDEDLDIEGWRYLFETYGKMPSQSKADNMFGWIYSKDISPIKPKLEIFISLKTTMVESRKKTP